MDKIISTDYKIWIVTLKEKFRKAQIQASIRVNSNLLEFYWELGSDIVEKQKSSVWGSGFLKQLSKDLSDEFTKIKGFSYRNIRAIIQWYKFYTSKNLDLATTCSQNENNEQSVLQLEKSLYRVVFQIPWGQNLVIISKTDSLKEALFYANKTIENGWSRAVLTHQIDGKLYERTGKAITNFADHLPDSQSDFANQLLKDPYNFNFLTLTEKFKERELEEGLVEHITQFLLELGSGFAYIGKEVEVTVGERDFYIDLLFYHTKLRCYVVIELKAVEFEPEHTGKLNFYIAAVDKQLKHEQDAPTIGILLCKSKDKTVVEYALHTSNTPIGVSEYELTTNLPNEFQSALPTIEEIEAEFGSEDA